MGIDKRLSSTGIPPGLSTTASLYLSICRFCLPKLQLNFAFLQHLKWIWHLRSAGFRAWSRRTGRHIDRLWDYLRLAFKQPFKIRTKQVRASSFYFTVPQEFHTTQLLLRGIRNHQRIFSTGQFATDPRAINKRSCDFSSNHCICLPGWDMCWAFSLCSKLCLPFCSFLPAAALLLGRSAEVRLLTACNFWIMKKSKTTNSGCSAQVDGNFWHSLHKGNLACLKTKKASLG